MPETAPSAVEGALKKNRDYATIVSERKTPVPINFPKGPWSSYAAAKDAISKHCEGLQSVGQGHGVVSRNKRVATKAAGEKRLIQCDRHNMPHATAGDARTRVGKGCSCGWGVWVEDATIGWVIKEGSFEHNHSLVGSREEALVHTAMRSIPEELASHADLLKLAGQSPADIDRYTPHPFPMSCL
jgi:hypothetical protein